METLWQDIRYGARQLLRSPGFTAVAVLTLALGIGANTAIFSVVNAVLLQPLPYHEPEELVVVWTRPQNQPQTRNPASLPDFRDWESQNRVFEGMAAYAYNRFAVSGPEGADYRRGIFATSNLLSLLGVDPVVGRPLTLADDREYVVLLSHRFWQERYAGDPTVIGRRLSLNSEPYIIIGVMPPNFRFPTPDVDLWLSFASVYAVSGNATIGNWIQDRSLHGYRVVARLRPDVGVEQAQAELQAVAQHLAEQYPDSNAGLGVALVPLHTQVVGGVQQALLVLLGAVGFVLLIACVNVANMLLARSSVREREFAVRRALGANTSRLVRQLLSESTLLAILGGSLGLFLAVWGVDLLVGLAPAEVPRLESVAVDGWVLGFMLVTSLVAGVLVGLAPGWRTHSADLNQSLRAGDRGATGHARRRIVRSLLVLSELALAVVLLAGAGLMLRSLGRLLAVDPGFRPDRLLTLSVALTVNRYQQAEQQVAFFEELLARIQSLPGVESAGACNSLPPNMIQRGSSFTIEGQPMAPGESPSALFLPITPDYLSALGVKLLEGRFFSESDTAAAPAVVLINQTLVQDYFREQSPLGKRIQLDGRLRTIVGVVGDVKYQGLHAPAGPQIYVPFTQSPFPGMYIAIRTRTDPDALSGSVREVIAALDPEVAPTRVRTMDEVIRQSVAEPRFRSLLLLGFSGLALALAAVGIYGVISYTASQRTHEMGVRLALGALPGDIVRLVVKEGMRLAAAGIGLGLSGAFALTRFLGSLLFEVTPTDPATLVGVAILLAAVALAACWIPARRAARVDPMVALRYE
ncbi:MAG: ABC transporter permease [Acidobacteria bacterium]|nr:ABC transporter permease [Acidobacteriota bacterium]